MEWFNISNIGTEKNYRNTALPLWVSLLKSSFVLFLAIYLSACNGVLKSWVCPGQTCSPVATNDFLKSQILVNGSAVANGTDQLTVFIHLVNSNGAPVSGFQPTYALAYPQGVIPSQCFSSDVNGLSICVLKSTTAGQNQVIVTNVDTIKLQQTILFVPPPDTPLMAQVSGGALQIQNAGPYSVGGTVGLTNNNPVQTVGPYKVYGSVEASVASGAGPGL